MSDIDRAARLLRHALELHECGREYSWQARYPVRAALKILEAHKKETQHVRGSVSENNRGVTRETR